MISAWTKHLKTDEEKVRFKNSVNASKATLERLQEILKEMESDQDRIERDVRIYDTPGWDYRIAHLNGFRDAINKVSKIITLDQGDK
jgi:exonuclease VII small subunit